MPADLQGVINGLDEKSKQVNYYWKYFMIDSNLYF